MKKLGHLIGTVFLLVPSLSFAIENCTDFSGNYKGVCRNLASLGSQSAIEIELNQEKCEKLISGGMTYLIDTEQLQNNVVGYKYRFRWNNEGKTLGLYIQRFPGPSSLFPSFTMSGAIEMEGDKLKYTSYYEDAHIEDCLLERQ